MTMMLTMTITIRWWW